MIHLAADEARRDTPPRVGFVVSKAVGNAVVRNRTKRRLRALMAQRVDQLPGGVDVVVRAHPIAAEATFADLGRDLDRGLRRCLSGGRRRDLPRLSDRRASGTPNSPPVGSTP